MKISRVDYPKKKIKKGGKYHLSELEEHQICYGGWLRFIPPEDHNLGIIFPIWEFPERRTTNTCSHHGGSSWEFSQASDNFSICFAHHGIMRRRRRKKKKMGGISWLSGDEKVLPVLGFLSSGMDDQSKETRSYASTGWICQIHIAAEFRWSTGNVSKCKCFIVHPEWRARLHEQCIEKAD